MELYFVNNIYFNKLIIKYIFFYILLRQNCCYNKIKDINFYLTFYIQTKVIKNKLYNKSFFKSFKYSIFVIIKLLKKVNIIIIFN